MDCLLLWFAHIEQRHLFFQCMSAKPTLKQIQRGACLDTKNVVASKYTQIESKAVNLPASSYGTCPFPLVYHIHASNIDLILIKIMFNQIQVDYESFFFYLFTNDLIFIYTNCRQATSFYTLHTFR